MKDYNLLSKFHSYNLHTMNIVLGAAFFFSLAYSVRAVYPAQVTLEWEASSGDVAGYKVCQGTSSEAYDATLDIGNWTSVTIADLAED